MKTIIASINAIIDSNLRFHCRMSLNCLFGTLIIINKTQKTYTKQHVKINNLRKKYFSIKEISLLLLLCAMEIMFSLIFPEN